MRHKIYPYLSILLMLISLSCETNEAVDDRDNKDKDSANEVSYKDEVKVWTDKARYTPNEEVNFSIDKISKEMEALYFKGGEVISSEKIASTTWSWSPPSDDFVGYMVAIVNADDEVLSTVGVDVSSDWKKFPRFGFLSNFDKMPIEEQEKTISFLNRYHLNALQYYDWHSTSQTPLPKDDNGNAKENWKNLFNRPVFLETLKTYIDEGHERNMASLFYDLIFGVNTAGDEYSKIPDDWKLYSDEYHNSVNNHDLGDFGAIELVDPKLEGWQNYIFDQVDFIYENLSFDGWHLDQLGDRGEVYNIKGALVNLPDSYKGFLGNLKTEFPEKAFALNAVDQFGQEDILSAEVDYSYSEVWSGEGFQGLANTIQENQMFSKDRINTVIAAYLNYNANDGTFNKPAVLLADAVIFAFGGTHIELGEHMLSNEYFPNDNVEMTPELKEDLRKYYDFLVAYQNYLRDGGIMGNLEISSTDDKVKINIWPPIIGKVSAFSKEKDDQKIIHLINFDGLSSLNWRDSNRIQTAPSPKNDFEVKIKYDGNPSKIWMASPDYKGGRPVSLDFYQDTDFIYVTIPSIKYWDMIVIE